MSSTNGIGFIINPQSLSQSAITNDLQTWVQSLPDYQSWQSFFASSAGTIVLQLIGGMGAYIANAIIVGRRENYLAYTQNMSSAIAIAETLGYSVDRGRNPVVSFTVTPNVTGLFNAFTSVGTILNRDIILLEDTVFNNGIETTFQAVIGQLVQEQQTIANSSPQLFRFQTGPVSDDYQLLLNSNVVLTSNRLIDLINQYFAVISNVLGSVDVSYLNLSSYSVIYGTGDILTLNYILLQDTQFSLGDINFDYGTLNTYSIVSLYQAPETLQEIQVNAPLFSETQFVIRGRDDYMKIFKLLNNTINSTSYIDVSPAVVQLTYATNNFCLFTDDELAEFITQLSSYRGMGIEPPLISQPSINFFNMNITVALSGSGNITTDVGNILDDYEQVLGTSGAIGTIPFYIDFAAIENQIDALDYVQISRPTYNPTTWIANTIYYLGNHVNASPANNGIIYQVVGFIYATGSIEPSFVLGNATYIDGRILWTKIAPPVPTPPILTWSSSTVFPPGSVILASGFYFQSSNYTPSASAIPAVPAQGTYEGVTYTANNAGATGNIITLDFDGTSTNAVILNNWNAVNPSNPASITTGSPTGVSTAGTLTLSGGEDEITNEPVWGNFPPAC
jgi:hypothetical protein